MSLCLLVSLERRKICCSNSTKVEHTFGKTQVSVFRKRGTLSNMIADMCYVCGEQEAMSYRKIYCPWKGFCSPLYPRGR